MTMECLPSDVVLDILSRLPVESVLDCKLVSKSLLNVLAHQWDEFAEMHHQRQLPSSGDASSSSTTGLLFSFKKAEKDETIGLRLYYGDKYNNEMNIHDYFSYKTLQETSVSFPYMLDPDGIVGSCNGLICLLRYHHGIPDPIHICNPNTGEYVNLPEYTLREKHYLAAYGFGCVNNQYKVVRILYPGSKDYYNGEVQVYTIGSDSGWRTVGTTSYRLFTVPSCSREIRVEASIEMIQDSSDPFHDSWYQFELFKNPCQGICVDGSLHWIERSKIVAFNLTDEEFRVIESPPCHDYLLNRFQRLQALRGKLCFSHQREEDSLLDIWSMKKHSIWSRDFSIAYHSPCECKYPTMPLLITKKNEVLFVHRDFLYFYDPKTNTVMQVWDDDDEMWELSGITAVPHMKSFVSLKALGERSEIAIKRSHEADHQQLASSGDTSSSSTGLLFSFKITEEDGTLGSPRLYYGDKYTDEMNVHDDYSYETLQETSISGGIVGSCNGLICLLRYHHGISDPIHICNPKTREYVNLPEYTLTEDRYEVAYGFGYVDSMTNTQYKVVRILYPGSGNYEKGEVQVYTIGSGSGWRTIGTTSYRLSWYPCRGICVNGSLHWTDPSKIVAFNLADEEFRVIQYPPCDVYYRTRFQELQALRGNLCLSQQRKKEYLLEIWSLKNNATESSWSLDFSIDLYMVYEIDYEYPAMPLLITNKNEVLFVHQSLSVDYGPGSTLYSYDPKTDTGIQLWNDDDDEEELVGLTAVPHMNSFVSLKALGERSEIKKKVMETNQEASLINQFDGVSLAQPTDSYFHF